MGYQTDHLGVCSLILTEVNLISKLSVAVLEELGALNLIISHSCQLALLV